MHSLKVADLYVFNMNYVSSIFLLNNYLYYLYPVKVSHYTATAI